jgi:mersacidin/lichenicidin family type 2 lantibiotic
MSGQYPEGQGELIANGVVRDPARPPEVNVVLGWIGASGREGFVRVYLRIDFSAYIELAESDILYSKHGISELEFSILWVKQTAQLQVTDSDIDVVRAWKDRDYRSRLTEAQVKALPLHPSGSVQVPHVLLDSSEVPLSR